MAVGGPEHPRAATTRRRFVFPERLADRHRAAGRLGPFLAWAVVYADIGTSIYYVPGLLFNELGRRTPSPAAAFVLVTGLAVILLALKYVDVSARYPDGGGVVSVATDAFNPLVGCIGGILISISYFLTGAISAVSGLQYLAGLFPVLDHWLVPGACAAIVGLGLLNYVGVRESAILTAVLAIASFVVNVIVVGVVSLQLSPAQWRLVMAQFQSAAALPPWPLLVGFSGSWLAYSGLESISQIAPALKPPREKTALRAMILVMAAILLISPLATALETALLKANQVNPDRFMFELGVAFGPRSLQLSIVITSAALLLGAANTALIGCYHVFLALVRLGFLPHWLSGRSVRFNTPHRAIVISVLAPVLVILASRAQLGILGEIYTFGLLGAFTLTSLGLDRVKWQERVRGVGFWLGVFTSALVVGAWAINLVHRRVATVLGVAVTLIGCAYSLAVKKGWVGAGQKGFVRAEDAEQAGGAMGTAFEILTVDEAIDMRSMYRSTTLVALRSPNLRMFQEAAARVRGSNENAVYLIFIDEIPGLFFPPNTGPSREAREVLAIAVEFFREAGLVAIPIWRMAHDAGASLAGAARKLEVGAVLVGTSQRGAVWHLLRGNILSSLVRDLPQSTRVWICN
ncbi:MAG TPA: APC family permease [Polyangia bacterium]|nr:APC family permease [Polyangia bacterium]